MIKSTISNKLESKAIETKKVEVLGDGVDPNVKIIY